jgi:hypothetical protein
VTGQRVVIINYETSTDGSYAAVFDDGFSADNGTGTSRPPSGSHSAKISQTISVAPNSDYFLFYQYGTFGGGAGQKIQVQAGSLNDTRTSAAAANPTKFKLYGHSFTTDGTGTATVSFKDATTSGEVASADGVLDAVNVEARVVYHQSFESGETANYTITSSNANPAHTSIQADPAYNGGQSTDGTQFREFNWRQWGVNEGNAILTSDPFATIPGCVGHIFFSFGNYGISGSLESIRVELLDAATSTPYFTFNASDATQTTAAYAVMDGYLLDYTAQATSTRLRITDTSGAATPGNDVLIDDLIVTMPEPGAATLGAGTGLLLLRCRRR